MTCGGNLQRHPAIGVLPHELPECGPRDVEILSRGDGVDHGRTRRVPLAYRERVVVSAPSFVKVRQLRLEPAVLVVQPVGVRAELPQAADEVLDPGAEHGRILPRTKRERKGLGTRHEPYWLRVPENPFRLRFPTRGTDKNVQLRVHAEARDTADQLHHLAASDADRKRQIVR
jgi:hypothetical protein